MGKLIVAILAGIATGLGFAVLLNVIGVEYPNYIPYLVGYISMEADLIKFDNIFGNLNKVWSE